MIQFICAFGYVWWGIGASPVVCAADVRSYPGDFFFRVFLVLWKLGSALRRNPLLVVRQRAFLR